MNGEKERFGAHMERGKVTEFAEGKYRLESISRPGITTPPLSPIYGLELEVGDMAFFCLFNDGTGIVIAKMTV